MNEQLQTVSWKSISPDKIRWMLCPGSQREESEHIDFLIADWFEDDLTAEDVASAFADEYEDSTLYSGGDWQLCNFIVYHMDKPICRLQPVAAYFLAGHRGWVFFPETSALLNCGCFEECERCHNKPKNKSSQPGYYQWTYSDDGF